MWASMGTGAIGVVIYKFTSTAGKNWVLENDGEPVVKPGSKDEHDSHGVETPAVIKVGDDYHMYYSFYPDEEAIAVSMAHATSKDGINWVKQGELTSLTSIVGNPAGNPWGWLARAEPTAVYYDNTYYLYFADVKCRQDNCQGFPRALRGISVATSKDGHSFTQTGKQPVLLQTSSYKPEDGWEGYSTPWVYHNGEFFELYVDLFRTVDGNALQTALAHYRSRDGINFFKTSLFIIFDYSTMSTYSTICTRCIFEDCLLSFYCKINDSFFGKFCK